VSRGSIIYGNSTPAWDELVIGANATFLRSNGTDAAWTAIAVGDLPTSAVPIGKHDLFVQAGAMRATNTAGCSAMVQNETTTNKVNYNSIDFDQNQTTEENAYFTVSLPRSYNNSTITAFFYWTALSGSGGVAWGIKALARSDDDALDTAFESEIVTTDTLIATG
jgi:hypothetical protein